MWVYIRQDVQLWIYHSPDLWLISLSGDWENWITIADKNLWATTVFEVWSWSWTNWWTTVTEANGWKFYQWGNNYWFPLTWATTTSSTQVNTSTYWPWNYYSSSTFITRNSSPYSWQTSTNYNLWWGTTWTNDAMQWPCDSGFHVPKYDEFDALAGIITDFWITWHNIMYCLKMPWKGNLNRADWTYNNGAPQLRFCAFWLSDTYYSWDTLRIYMLTDNYWNTVKLESSTLNSGQDSIGYTIRPFANTPVQPDNTRTVLYQPN